MVDIKALKEKAKAKVKQPQGLCAVILGPSGAGKSTAAASIGKEVLFLTCSTESHGPVSAKIHGANITPFIFDQNEDGTQKAPDQAIADLFSVLKSPDIVGSFDTVVVDSLTDFELLVLRSNWVKEFATGSNGKVNSFRVPEAVLQRIQELFEASHQFRAKGVHFVVTLPAHVTGVSADGTADSIAPLLSSYAVAERVPRLADQVLFVAQVEVGGVNRRVFLFDTEIARQQKDLGGNVKRYLNFRPSIRSVRDENLPSAMTADLKKVLAMLAKEATNG